MSTGIENWTPMVGQFSMPVDRLPDDWLRRKAASIGIYQGDASPIYVTEGKHADDVAERVLGIILAREPIGDPPLPQT